MNQSITRPFPRLLLGTTLVFWGWMNQQPLAGLAAAFLLEGSTWLGLRWNFTEKAYVRAWTISMLAFLTSAAYVYLTGVSADKVRALTAWLPIMLIPIQFTISYGISHTLPLHTFSYLKRKQIKRDKLAGRTLPPPRLIHFTPIFFALTLLLTSLGKNATDYHHLIILIILLAWYLIATKSPTTRLLPLSLTLLITGIAAYFTQNLLHTTSKSFTGFNLPNAKTENSDEWTEQNTRIGKAEIIKQSPRIYWRLRTEKGAPPPLLRCATYNTYLPTGIWRYIPPNQITTEEDFQSLIYPGLTPEQAKALISQNLRTPSYRSIKEVSAADQAPAHLPHFTLRGTVKKNTILPIPGSLHTIHIDAQDIETNSLGSIRLDPRHAALQTLIHWNGIHDAELPPMTFPHEDSTIDLYIPAKEKPTLKQIATTLQLHQKTLPEIIPILHQYFHENFQYTLKLSSQLKGDINQTSLTRFLTKYKKGHCEYFATATTLLLREAGIPARYSVGFTSGEYDLSRKEYTIRGTHAHAWCRAWHAPTSRWIDIDTTPPNWLTQDTSPPNWRTRLLDLLQRTREDFTIWRTQPQNIRTVTAILTLAALTIATYTLRRLWLTRIKHQKQKNPHLTTQDTPLILLEKKYRKHLPPRPSHTPYATWLKNLEPHLDPATLHTALTLHNQHRYDPHPPPQTLTKLQQTTKHLLEKTQKLKN